MALENLLAGPGGRFGVALVWVSGPGKDGSAVLVRVLGYFADGGLENFDFCITGLEGHGVVADGLDDTDDAGRGGDVIAGLEILEEGGLFLGALLLGGGSGAPRRRRP